MSSPFSPSSVTKQLDFCTFCPKMCRLACPVANASGRETLIPQAKMDLLNQLRRGRQPWTVEGSEPLWGCTGCRECSTYCELGNEPGLVLMSGRAEAAAHGVTHPRLENYPDRFRNRDERLVKQLRDHIPADRFAEDALVGYWPGCDAIDKGMEEIVTTLEIFDAIGADHVRLVDSSQACLGYPLLAAGYPDMFRWHAAKVAATLKKFKTVIINCSACIYTLRALYPGEGVPLQTEILALSEFLAQSVTRWPKPKKKRTVYYHDPCYLARYAGIVDAPRMVLSQLAEVREFAWSRADTECCGGAGLLPKTMPDVADAMARRRLTEIANRGGGMVVTSCGTCSFMLRQNAPDGVEVLDLPAAIAELRAELE